MATTTTTTTTSMEKIKSENNNNNSQEYDEDEYARLWKRHMSRREQRQEQLVEFRDGGRRIINTQSCRRRRMVAPIIAKYQQLYQAIKKASKHITTRWRVVDLLKRYERWMQICGDRTTCSDTEFKRLISNESSIDDIIVQEVIDLTNEENEESTIDLQDWVLECIIEKVQKPEVDGGKDNDIKWQKAKLKNEVLNDDGGSNSGVGAGIATPSNSINNMMMWGDEHDDIINMHVNAITTQQPAKRLKQSTMDVLKKKPARKTNKIGILVLPAKIKSACGVMSKILQYLDIRSLLHVKESSLIQQCRKVFESDDFELVRGEALGLEYEGGRSINEMIYAHPAWKLYSLIKRYQREFQHGTRYGGVPTPIVCACQHGRMDDVELFVNLHPYHKYITNRDVNGYRDDMTLKDMANQSGKDSSGYEWTPLMAAAGEEHFQIVQYLIEQGEADPNIANSDGSNALHLAAGWNRTNTGLIQLLLTHMTLDSINKKNRWGYTPLGTAYDYRLNTCPIKHEIIALLKKYNGDLNY